MVLKEAMIVLFLAAMLASPVSALFGISPGKYDVDFKPGETYTFPFKIITDDGVRMELSLGGDLSEHATISRSSVVGTADVIVTLKLPRKLEPPGMHQLVLVARQAVQGRAGVALLGGVYGPINVRVPYPEEYAEIAFTSTNANLGEPVTFSLTLTNLGERMLTTTPSIEIFSATDSKKKKILETLSPGVVSLSPLERQQYILVMNTTSYKAGSYLAEAIVPYGKSEARAEAPFRIGELLVNITSYTKEFERGGIRRFDVGVESFWKEPIEDVVGNVTFLQYPISFITPTLRLDGFGNGTLTGYFDTTPIVNETFDALILVTYAGNKSIERRVALHFTREVDYMLYSLIASAIVLMIIVGFIIWRWLRGRARRRNR
ncbi:MAG TPA: hypothetical protein VJK03_04055 [Candidatus Nanoarchaeia archaeon]|nr:hypothetical protein [Candidatus Nanoarchaeia archaeon]